MTKTLRDWSATPDCTRDKSLDLQTQEADGEDVHRQAKFAQTPSARKKWLATNSLDDQAANRHDVRADQRPRAEGGDDVQRHGTTQIDQSDEHREGVGEEDCI